MFKWFLFPFVVSGTIIVQKKQRFFFHDMNFSAMDNMLLGTVKKCDDNNKNKIEIYFPRIGCLQQKDELIKKKKKKKNSYTHNK